MSELQEDQRKKSVFNDHTKTCGSDVSDGALVVDGNQRPYKRPRRNGHGTKEITFITDGSERINALLRICVLRTARGVLGAEPLAQDGGGKKFLI